MLCLEGLWSPRSGKSQGRASLLKLRREGLPTLASDPRAVGEMLSQVARLKPLVTEASEREESTLQEGSEVPTSQRDTVVLLRTPGFYVLEPLRSGFAHCAWSSFSATLRHVLALISLPTGTSQSLSCGCG